jgi:3'-phosphoadenosine 5'-phosphosulfate (PAPS) 3'-phosphatase
MTDISNLSFKQLQQLEKQIEERKELLKQSKDCIEGYKITFCVKFNPAEHQFDELKSPEEFGDYLANDVVNYIVKDGFPDLIISGFEVEEMTDEYKVEWKDFWENEE